MEIGRALRTITQFRSVLLAARTITTSTINSKTTAFLSPNKPHFTTSGSFLNNNYKNALTPHPFIMFRHFITSLTDTRFPKRRPLLKPCRKRSSLKPPGPYAWVKYTPGEPITPNNPNEGSLKRRNEKKRIKQHRSFIMQEKRKRKAQMQEANRKKIIKRVERKMAAVARERDWAERLAELQRLEEEKKSMA
ncbi:hypothetical protein ACFE04_012542 [Oxalis oulophora]